MTLLRASQHHTLMAVVESEKRGCPKPPKRQKKANNPPIDKYAILIHRSRLCECGCGQMAHDLHHALIGRRKGYPVLDDERNLIFVNHDEHIAGKFDNLTWRVKFWQRQIKRFGEALMQEWIDAVLAAGLDASRLDFLR